MFMDKNKDRYDLNDLKQLMARLRDPDNGCPWDLDQTFDTVKSYTVEEAYEVSDAIERGTKDDLKDELGDLLFQIMFHTQMASEDGDFTLDDVIDHVTKKMIFRHPHVFSDENGKDAQDVEERVWEAQKAKEKAKNGGSTYTLDDVTRALPALSLANKVQKRVCKIGFAYPSIDNVYEKLNEEIEELKQAESEEHIAEEFGDVLFVTALLGYHLKTNPENALREGVFKFIKRFNAVEDELSSLENASLDDMQSAWQKIKNNT
jgi:ATP diphosphatase